MLLIRDGTLYVGGRPFPLAGKPRDLTLGQGLLQTEALPPLLVDPGFDADAPENRDKRPPTRDQFKLTLKGRPDLKPGDVVKFDAPKEEIVEKTTPGLGAVVAAVANVFAGPIVASLGVMEHPLSLYVAGVEHRLGRTSAFMTTVTGVVVADDLKDPWDTRTRRHVDPREPGSPDDGTGDGRVARAITQRLQAAVDQKRFMEIGEVREVTSSGTDEPPAQTETVWRGLEPADGKPSQARRLKIKRPSPAPRKGVPYATPFAWGRCGLVLPRYPGTRVVLVHRNGERDDPVDVGAIWESGRGPDSQPGDYWLALPVGVPSGKRAALPDSADPPAEHTGTATNDLIDADGNRVIEVGELTIRVGRSALKSAGTRPTRGTTDAVTIEHAGGKASIIVKSDGTITIHAGANLELSAGGTISLDAAQVKVKVAGTMDVSKKV